MLSSPAKQWPAVEGWVLQPKWDGFRLLVDIDANGEVRAWSRHGTNLTDRVGGLCDEFRQAPASSTFDGELVAAGGRDGQPAQDFACVQDAVLRRRAAAAARLCFVGFDVLHLDGEDVRARSWSERDTLLAEALPGSPRVQRIGSQPAMRSAHERIVELGFEGTVLKRPSSPYRPGRQTAWLKHKARHEIEGVGLAAHRDRDGVWHLRCDVGGQRPMALSGRDCRHLVGVSVALAYSRVDADGGLRELRVLARQPASA